MMITSVLLLLLAVLVYCNPNNERFQLLPASSSYFALEDLKQSSPSLFGSLTSSLASSKKNKDKSNTKLNLLLYITTHFSAQHLRYFHCCWPKLIQESPLVSLAHVLIVASNHTPVEMKELNYLSSLFQKNPSYHIRFLSADYPNNNNPCEKFRHEVPKGSSNANTNTNPLKMPVNYKQCMANLGVRAGFEHGWVYDHSNSGDGSTTTTTTATTVNVKNNPVIISFDWMIRINPDVLIRKSKWLLETMQDSVDAIPTAALLPSTSTTLTSNATLAIVVPCATRQFHTDFFALRPHAYNRTTCFSKMGRKGNKWNHERTAYKELNNKGAIKYLPTVDPSEGSCRVRGENASVYHVHDSCREEDGKNMICSALDGWDLN